MFTLIGFTVFSLIAGGIFYMVDEEIWRENKPAPQYIRVRTDERRSRRIRR